MSEEKWIELERSQSSLAAAIERLVKEIKVRRKWVDNK